MCLRSGFSNTSDRQNGPSSRLIGKETSIFVRKLVAHPHISYHQWCFECTQALSSIELSEEVPHLDSDVLTVGYPMGGENICVTRGVVSWHIRKGGVSSSFDG